MPTLQTYHTSYNDQVERLRKKMKWVDEVKYMYYENIGLWRDQRLH